MGIGKKRMKRKKKSKGARPKRSAKKRGRPLGSKNRATTRKRTGLPLDNAIDRVAAVESELEALKQTLTKLRSALYGS